VGTPFDPFLPPRRLGSRFRWMLASAWLSNLGDGMSLAAGPLLVASLTHRAAYVALAATLVWLPRLLWSLVAGVVTDRLDRRSVVVGVSVAQSIGVAALAVAVAAGHVSIVAVFAMLFLSASAEVFADNSFGAMLPMLVPSAELGAANARLTTAFITFDQLAGPPIGAVAFAVAPALPFAIEAALGLAAAVLVLRVGRAKVDVAAGRRRILHDIREGLAWTARHAAVRTLTLTIFIFNISFGAAWSVLVLYAHQRLGLGAVGFGLLTTVSAIGGLLGTASYEAITRRMSLGAIMRVGLILETLTHLALAVVTNAWIAMAIFFVFGAHAFIWSTTSTTVRQQAAPLALQGRVNTVNSIGVFGGLVIGSAIGGALAQRYDVTAPFWFAFGASALFLVGLWRQLSLIAVEDAPDCAS
jgi:MFS family permease